MFKLNPVVLLAALLPTIPAQAEDLAYPSRYGQMAESMVDMMDAFAQAYQKRSGDKGSSSGSWPTPPSGGWPMGADNWSSMATAPWSMTGNPWSSMTMAPWSMGATPWASMQKSPWSMTDAPWSSMPGTPWSGNGNPAAAMGNFPAFPAYGPNPRANAGEYPSSGPTTPLDGKWQGQSGELLVISGGRFRIYQGREHFQEGQIRVDRQNVLSMRSSGGKVSRCYEYAVHQGRLALRDTDGNLLLYRRIR